MIPFHRILISSGIAFCALVAAWALWRFAATGSATTLVLGLVFVGLAAALGYYLRHLNRFLGR